MEHKKTKIISITNNYNPMKRLIFLIVCLIALVSSKITRGQHFNMSPVPVDEKMSIGLKVNKPFFKKSEYGYNPRDVSGVYKIYGFFPLKNNWQINAEIPLVVAIIDETDETGLGNLYVELQKSLNAGRTTYLALGFYIPTIGIEKYERMFIGMLSDPYRFFQYLEGFTFSSTFGYNSREKPGVLFGADFGPDLFVSTSKVGDVELLIHYGLKGGYQFNAVSAWAELSGILIVTEEGSLDEKWTNQLFFGTQYNRGRIRPGIFYGIHLDKDVRESIGGVLGLNLQMVLN